MDWRRDILDLLLADIGELHRELVGDLLVDGARDADAADRRDALQTRRDVYAVAEKIAVALDHVADGDADAEAHLPAGRIGRVAGAQAFLDVEGAAHRLDGAGKFGEHGVARGIENPPAGAGDEVVHHRAIGGEPPQRLLLVFGDELAVAGNVGSENGRDFSVHRTPAASLAGSARLQAPARSCNRPGTQRHRLAGSRQTTAPAPLVTISIARGG